MSLSDSHNNEVLSAYYGVADVFDDIFRNYTEADAHAAWLVELLQRHGAKRIIDVAAGTGEQSVRLWQSGIFDGLIANDVNGAMLGRLREKFHWNKIPFIDGFSSASDSSQVILTKMEWSEIASELPTSSFDAITCLGHSFFHLVATEKFTQVLTAWKNLLRPGGIILLDFYNDDATTLQMRNGTFKPKPWEWCIDGNVQGRSGRKYVQTYGYEYRSCPEAPLGWRTWNTWIVAELTGERVATNLRTLSTGGAVLDLKAIEDIAVSAGFKIGSLSKPSPRLYVNVHDVVLVNPEY